MISSLILNFFSFIYSELNSKLQDTLEQIEVRMIIFVQCILDVNL